MPDLPARMAAQVISVPCPKGVIRPIPVTTTRRMPVLKRGQSSNGGGPQRKTAEARVGPRPGGPKTLSRIRGLSAQSLLNELHGVAHRLDVLGCVVRDFDIELLLESHDQLDVVEAVGAQVVDEAGLLGHLLRIGVQVLDNDLTDAF